MNCKDVDLRTPLNELLHVTVRVKPPDDKDDLVWVCENNYIIRNRMVPKDAYVFERLFGPACSTRKVYDVGAKSIVMSTLIGVSAIVFAYGQTNTGKTVTMRGITENAINDIFEHINLDRGRDFSVKFSALDISGEDVTDLLNPESSPLGLLEVPKKVVVEDIADVTRLISVCEARRQVGETATSDTSSSPHKIIILTVESRPCRNSGHVNSFIASLNLVDLAGSEQASDIGGSVGTLRTVIEKLRLQSFRTAMICTISPALSSVEQSRSTLLFATHAKKIRSVPGLGMYVREPLRTYPSFALPCIHSYFYDENSVQKQSKCLIWPESYSLPLSFGLAVPYDSLPLNICSGLPPIDSDWEPKIPWLFYYSTGTKWRFLHPLTGDIYETHIPLLANATFLCSKFGWVLMSRDPGSLFFFNPFTNKTIDLPVFKHSLIFESTTFTAPPTSCKCRVIILGNVYKGPPSNRISRLIACTCARGGGWNQQIITPRFPFQVAECNPIFFGDGKYDQLGAAGNLAIVRCGQDGRVLVVPLENPITSEAALDKRLYITKHEGKVHVVYVGRLDGTPVQVFKQLFIGKFEPVDTIGKITMFLSKHTTVSVSAKANDIGDHIYFPIIRKRYRKTETLEEIVFYYMGSGSYYYHRFDRDFHSFDLSEFEEAGFSRSTWIMPNISKTFAKDEEFDWSFLPPEEEEERDAEFIDFDLENFDQEAFWAQMFN